MKETWPPSFALFLLTITIMHAANAQVYKCEDASGKTIYSGTPCSTEFPVNDQEIQLNENVLDNSGSRSLHQSIQRQARSESSNQSKNTQGRGDGGELARQRQLGQQWIEEARKISSKSERKGSPWDRATQNGYAKRLQESAAILLGARQGSSQAVEMLEEANALAKRATGKRDLWDRASLFSQADHLQQSARTLLGSQGASPSPNPSSNTPKPASPSVITNCDGAGCVDNLGNRYNPVGGSMYVPTTGGPSCQAIGGMMHCP